MFPVGMKTLRILLMLLVALILPFKGAMAAVGMFCYMGSSQPISAAMQPDQHRAGMAQDQTERVAPASDAKSAAPGDAGPMPAMSSCAICAAVCSAPPLPAPGIAFHADAPSSAERFPALATPRPSTAQSGLDRPPRTL